MAFYEWNNSLSVGYLSIDNQHKKLINMINSLYDAMGVGKGKDVVEKLLNDLVDYTKTHFSNEEVLMSKFNYPDYNSHRAEHDKLLKQVKEFQDKLKSGESVLSITLMNFLKELLNVHIMKIDVKLGSFLANKLKKGI